MNFKITPLYEGTYSVASDHEFKKIKPTDKPEKGALKLSIHPFLIQDDQNNILFDVGSGELEPGDTTELIKHNLYENGIETFEISDVFLSHLHFDHIGGLAGRDNGFWELTFPDARIWLSGKEWNKLKSRIESFTEHEQDFINFIDLKADICEYENNPEPTDCVRAELIGGHTEHSYALYYENGDQKFIMAGDVIGTRNSVLSHYIAKYDFDGKQSLEVRKKLIQFAIDNHYGFLAYHDTDCPVFTISENSDSETIKTTCL